MASFEEVDDAEADAFLKKEMDAMQKGGNSNNDDLADLEDNGDSFEVISCLLWTS
jgi:hypothetical protein